MRQSQLITKTRKEAPADETAKNAQLLIRAGYVHKDAAGVYVWLPLGLRVLSNIIRIIREEMNAIGGQEVTMSTLQRQELWSKTDRWSDEKVDVWFKSELKNGTPVGLAWSHEEQMVDTFRQFISSYNDMPSLVYQFQNKMRNETRAKSGVMRTREFIMKDMYSFSKSEEEHQKVYEDVTRAYLRIFDRLGIGSTTYYTFASGGAFAEFSHEFQTICDAGEDIVYIDDSQRLGINEEVYRDDVLNNLGVDKSKLRKAKTAEVGNIFSFGTSKSEPLEFKYTDENGNQQYVVMGSYGIGPARVMGVIVEHQSDENGLVWSREIAPFLVHIVTASQDLAVVESGNQLYEWLTDLGYDVMYDDRAESAGVKFADADLIGIPFRITIGKKSPNGKNEYEVQERSTKEVNYLTKDEILKLLASPKKPV